MSKGDVMGRELEAAGAATITLEASTPKCAASCSAMSTLDSLSGPPMLNNLLSSLCQDCWILCATTVNYLLLPPQIVNIQSLICGAHVQAVV